MKKEWKFSIIVIVVAISAVSFLYYIYWYSNIYNPPFPMGAHPIPKFEATVSSCNFKGIIPCSYNHELDETWNHPYDTPDGGKISCRELLNCSSCDDCIFFPPSGTTEEFYCDSNKDCEACSNSECANKEYLDTAECPGNTCGTEVRECVCFKGLCTALLSDYVEGYSEPKSC